MALTIDLSLQEAVEAALAKRIEEMTRADGILRAGAAAVVVALPITLLFMWLQKYYVQGVTGGAVKG